MRKSLVSSILAVSFSILSCTTIPKEEVLEKINSSEQIMLMGFYEQGIKFVKDTDKDGKLDTIDYYLMIGTKNPDADLFDPTNYFILKYERSEPFEE